MEIVNIIVSVVVAFVSALLGAKLGYESSLKLQELQEARQNRDNIRGRYLSYLGKLQEFLYFVRQMLNIQELAKHHSSQETILKTTNDLHPMLGAKAYQASLEQNTEMARDYNVALRDRFLNLYSLLGDLENRRMEAILSDDKKVRRERFQGITSKDTGYSERELENVEKAILASLREVEQFVVKEFQTQLA